MRKVTIKHSITLILMVFSFFFCFGGLPVKAQDYTYNTGDHIISINGMQNNNDIYELLINGQVVVRYRSMYKGLSAKERAEVIFERCKNMGNTMTNAQITMGKINGSPVVLNGNKLLITVTEADWKANNSTGEGLAYVWAKNIGDAIKKPLSNDANIEEQPKIQQDTQELKQEVSLPSNEEKQMLELINKERKKVGVAPLKMNLEIVKIARIKSQDMIDKNYFNHTSPTYGDPFKMMKDFGVSYHYAGENLAGNSSVTSAHESLMNSQGHKKNILNPDFDEIGIGIVDGGPYGKMFTQMFIRK